MGYAHVYDQAALSELLLGFKSQDVTSEVQGAEIDRDDYGSGQLQHCEIVVQGSAAFATGAADDTLDVTLELEDSAVSGSGYVTYKTATLNIVVDDNSAYDFVASLPVKLLGADRYIRPSVLVANTGTGTLSSCTAACAVRVYPMNGQPASAYSKDGYSAGVATA